MVVSFRIYLRNQPHIISKWYKQSIFGSDMNTKELFNIFLDELYVQWNLQESDLHMR